MISIFADGASRGNPGPASYGALIVEDGVVLAELFEQLGFRTNNYAEYQGAIAALRWVCEHRPGSSVLLQMDSKLVIEQLSGNWQVKHPELRELCSEALRIARDLKLSLRWIPREENSAADALANRALDGEISPVEDLVLAAVQPKSIRAPRQHIEPTTVVLVRHGHTAITEANLVSGGHGEDPELSQLGVLEAAAAAAALDPLLIRHRLSAPIRVIHSDQRRTTQTAAAFASHYSLESEPTEALREIRFGDWEGLSMTELERAGRTDIDLWRGSVSIRPPQGESIRDLEARVLPKLKEVIHNHPGETVILVSHMMPCRAIAKNALGAADSSHWGIQFAPASLSIIRYFGTEFAEIICLNSCDHLPLD